MADPIQTRNVIAQTSLVEKIKQVQQQQGDLHQRNVANPKKDELERKTRAVQKSQESAEAKIGDKGKRDRKKAQKEKLKFTQQSENNRGDTHVALEDEDSCGKIIDIRV